MRKDFAQKNYKRVSKRKYVALGAMIAMTGAVMGTGIAEAKYVLAEPPTFPVNTLNDIQITRIVPSDGIVEVKFDKLDKTADYILPCFSMGYGTDLTDYDLRWASCGIIDEDVNLYNERTFDWEEGTSLTIMGDLTNNVTGRMYYGGDTSNFSYVVGRIDYSRCINSSVYLSGVATECRMEKIADGKIWYQPYDMWGNRVEIPADEDVELILATENVVYEPGDWPPQYKWVPDDPEPGEDDGGTGDSESGTGESESGEGGTDGSEAGSDTGGIDTDTGTGVGADTGTGAGAGADTDTGTDGAVNASSGTVSDATNTTGGDNATSTGDTTDTTNIAADSVSGEDLADSSVENKISYGYNTEQNSSTDDNSSLNNIVASAYSAQESGDNGAQIIDNDGDEVAVPELGKEFGNKGFLVATLIGLAAIAAGVAWWFIFFGKKKVKNEKGDKE